MSPSPGSATRGPYPVRVESCHTGRNMILSWISCWMRCRTTALLGIELGGLLAEEPVDVGIDSVRVGPARGHEGVDPRGGVSGDAADGVDETLQLLLAEGVQHRGALNRTELRPYPGRLQIVEHRFGGAAHRGVAPEVAALEALGIAGFREELPGARRIERVDRRLPVEVEARGDDAP